MTFQPIVSDYDPLRAGSIDGTDTEPHDRAIIRALNTKYKPNKGVVGDPKCTVFVGRLNHNTTEETIKAHFDKYGHILNMRLVRDLVTGFSKGYAFIEFADPDSAYRAMMQANRQSIDDKPILVEMECERMMRGWIPRRLGGGLSGRKESGQLRFGGRDRPFAKPIAAFNSDHKSFKDNHRKHRDDYRNSHRDSYDRHGRR